LEKANGMPQGRQGEWVAFFISDRRGTSLGSVSLNGKVVRGFPAIRRLRGRCSSCTGGIDHDRGGQWKLGPVVREAARTGAPRAAKQNAPARAVDSFRSKGLIPFLTHVAKRQRLFDRAFLKNGWELAAPFWTHGNLALPGSERLTHSSASGPSGVDVCL
jgi:hypothetical protein